MKSKTIKIAAAAAILAVVAVLVIGLSLDRIVKHEIETRGPPLAKVDIRIDRVGISLLSGTGVIDGLVAGNPEGYKSPEAIRAKKIGISLAPSSLLSHKLIIKSIRVDAPEITYETGRGGSNLKKILANLNEATRSEGGAAATSSGPDSGKKLEVDDFLLTGAKIHLDITGLGGATVPLPEIHLTDLGRGDAGITSLELTKRVLAAIEQVSAETAATAAASLVKNASGLIKKAAGGKDSSVSGAIGRLGKGVGDLFK